MIELRPYQTEIVEGAPTPAWDEFRVIRGQHPRDLSGQAFGRLTPLYPVAAPGKRWKWWTRCECGQHRLIKGSDITSGNSRSCGCDQRLAAAEACQQRKTHGRRNTRLYAIWRSMRARCSNPNNIGWEYYGGRGVRVCAQWARFEEFAAWADANGYRDDLTIDRIDVNGNYDPGNCRWATYVEQAANKRPGRRGHG